MNKNCKKLLFGIFCCIIVQMSALAVNDINLNIIPQTGSINAHDMDNLKRFEAKQKIQEDFKTYKQRAEKKEKAEKIKRNKKKVKKANPEDYATKGVYIENIIVTPSKILTKDEINDIIEEYTQANVTFEQLMQIVNKINELYAEKGFVTARAYLPVQEVENETVKIVLVEGKVGEVKVSDTKWTRPSYVEKRINLEKGEVFNIADLEQNLVTFNRYNDNIQLKGSLQAGKEEETTDITVNVEEKLPFHLSVLADNQGRESIGKYRAGLMLQDDSLFGFRDKLTIGAYASKHSITPFADYNIPVNRKDGRVGISYSYGLSQVKDGAYSMFNIESKSHNYSLYYNQPLIRKPWMELSSNSSVGFKYSETSFEKVKLYENKIPYLQTGLNFRYDTKRGIWYLGQNASFSFPFFNSQIRYLKIDGGLLRLHDFGHGFVGQIRANYQVIPGKDIVPYADQMTAGGMNTVRGYTEGLLIGKNGYIIGTELQFPILARAIKSGDKSHYIPFLGNYLKGFVFWDFAGIFPYKGTGLGEQTANRDDYLTSLGCGFKIMLPKDLSLRIAWGFPLFYNRHEERHKWGRFHFDLNISPDFDYLLKHRKPKGEPVEMVQAPESEQNQDKVQFADYVAPVEETVQEENIINVSNTQNKSTSNQAELDEERYGTENMLELDIEQSDNSIRTDLINLD